MTDFRRSSDDALTPADTPRQLGPDVQGVVRDAVDTVNSNALTTGTRSEQMLDALAPAKAALVADVTRDLGGEVPTTLKRLIDAHSETTLLRESVFLRMAGEPVTAKGKCRAMLNAYLQLVDRELRLAQVIGLERREKPVNPLDAVQRAVERANRR